MSKDTPRMVGRGIGKEFLWERDVQLRVDPLVPLYWAQRDFARWKALPYFRTERVAIRKEGVHVVAVIPVPPFAYCERRLAQNYGMSWNGTWRVRS